MQIERLDAHGATALVPALVALLQDTVDSGGTVGFVPPLAAPTARAYWHEVIAALQTPYRMLLIAREGGQVLGTVQLDLATRENGLHRAEIMKLMVAPGQRRRGIARALMQAIEAEALRAGRTTLILDTREGEPSEQLYQSLGYTRVGTIPAYARNADGTFHSTVIFYKLLPSDPQAQRSAPSAT